jgi:short-subunit dehydrogenase
MIDINLRGVLHGIAAALPVFRRQGRGHFVTTVSTSGLKIVPTQAVYAATKNAVRTLLEALRQESTDGVLRTTSISPGYVRTELADHIDDPDIREQVLNKMATLGIKPDAVARAVAFAIEQPTTSRSATSPSGPLPRTKCGRLTGCVYRLRVNPRPGFYDWRRSAQHSSGCHLQPPDQGLKWKVMV